MINFIDENGKQHSAIVECKKTKGVNGEKSLTGTIYTNDEILEGIGRGWRLQFEDENYCLTYANPIDEGTRIVVEFDAVHEFFFDMSKSVVYAELNGSNTAGAYLDFIFKGSGYEYHLEVTIPAFEKESFGMKNRLDLFKDFVSSTGVEFSVSGKIVRILEKVGSNLSTIVKKGFNLNELRIEKNIGNFITYLKGYGAYNDPEDQTKGRLEVEYLSPLASIYGKLEGNPIVDERYKNAASLTTRLKNEIESSYGISVDIDMEDLTKAGYEYDQPHEGDYIMAINEDLGFEQKIRIMSYTTSYDTEGNVIDHDVSCGSDNLVSQVTKSDNDFRKNVQAGLENAVNTANQAWISADGKNKVFTGTDEPIATNKGDIWYQIDGEKTIMKFWNGYEWQEFIDPKAVQQAAQNAEAVGNAAQAAADEAKEVADEAKTAGQNAKDIANQASTNAQTALDNANDAVDKAAQASQKADSSATMASDAKNQAATAESNANTALTNANKAINDVGDLKGVVTTNTASIEDLEDKVAIKADKSTVDAVTGRVSTAEGNITTMAGQISLKANQSDVDTVKGRVSATEASLTLQDGKITTLTTKTDGLDTSLTSLTQDYNGFKGTVYTKSQTDTKITTVQASVDQFKTTVSDTYSTKTETKAVKNSVDSLGTNIAYAWSPDGTDRFTRTKPNENLILGSDASSKSGFFKNFDLVKDGYGEVTMTSAKTYTSIDLREGYSVGIRNYPVGAKVRISFEIMYTAWNFPSGTDRAEFWLGQRYTSGPSGSTGDWRGVTSLVLPAVGDNGRVLNAWYPVTAIFTIPEQASEGVGDDCILRFYNSSTTSASFTARIRKPKMEYGWDQTIYTTNPQDDYDNAVPRYIGRSLKDSTNPADFIWEPNPDRKPWTSYAQGLNGEGLSLIPYGENLATNTSNSFTISGQNEDNQGCDMYGFSKSSFSDFGFKENDLVICSMTWETEATTGSFRVEMNNFPWVYGDILKAIGTNWDNSNITTISSSKKSGKIAILFKVSSASYNSWATRPKIRFDYLENGKSFTVKEYKLELANTMGIPTPWTPAPSEDPLGAMPKYVGTAALPYEDWTKYDWRLSSDWNEVKASTSIDQTNKAIILKADHTTVNTISGRVSTNEGKITLLSDRMNFRITNSDGSITQIDLANKVISLSGDQVNITGNTYIANGVIKTANIADLAVSTAKIADLAVTDAKISSLTANKITAGTIDANVITVKNISASNITGGTMTADRINGGTINGGNVNIINLNASNITSGTISGTNLSINLATGEVNFKKGVIQKMDGKFLIDVTQGIIESYQSSGGFTLNSGNIELRNSSMFNSNSGIYGRISWSLGILSATGLCLEGKDGWQLTKIGSQRNVLSRHTGSGIYGDTELGIFAQDKIKLSGGTLAGGTFATQPQILIGCNYSNISQVGADIDIYGNYVQIRSEKGTLINGNLSVTGSKNAIHKVGNDWIATPAYETAESYLGDIGSNQTNESGEVTVNVEYLFSRIVNTNMEYQVFVSPYGEGHVWVEQRYPLFFVVKSSKPNTPFAFEIKAKRKGYEFDRLVKQVA